MPFFPGCFYGENSSAYRCWPPFVQFVDFSKSLFQLKKKERKYLQGELMSDCKISARRKGWFKAAQKVYFSLVSMLRWTFYEHIRLQDFLSKPLNMIFLGRRPGSQYGAIRFWSFDKVRANLDVQKRVDLN